MPWARGLPGHRALRITTATTAVFSALPTGFGGLFPIVGKVATRRLAPFAARFRGALRIVGKITTRRLPAFAASFCSTSRVVGKVAARCLTTLAPCFGGAFRVIAKLPPDACPPFFPASDALSRSLAKLPGLLFPVLAISFTSLVKVENEPHWLVLLGKPAANKVLNKIREQRRTVITYRSIHEVLSNKRHLINYLK